MCGLMSVTGSAMKLAKFKENFAKIAYRGPDMTRYVICDDGIMGFHRLAIMGLSPTGMQPMELHRNLCICNGEIYNFRTLKTALHEHIFLSESDCEVLLPMYDMYGVDMFQKLDGEFAMVMYLADTKEWLAARDPLGIRPLFYGYQRSNGKIAFASEAKALVDFCDEIYPFPIGSYYKDGQFISYHDCTNVSPSTIMDPPTICAGIRSRLTDAVIKRLDSDAPIGFLLSGGLDSTLVCTIAAQHMKEPIHTFAIGMKKDAIDLTYAQEAADYIGSIHHTYIMESKDVIPMLKELIYRLETYDITTIRASIGMYFLCKKIHEDTDIKVILSGEVSDELFGYKYTDYAPDAQAFQEEAKKRIRELYMYDVLRADRCISSHALEARVPFSDKEFVAYVMGIDPSLKMNHYGIGKYLLREAFHDKDLPHALRMREKAAFSDAVGHSLVDDIKAYAQQYYTDEEFAKKQTKYAYHVLPQTKEALLYREIFESMFPNRAYWIKDYWMPNKTWPGCDVDDPSARVLANYGNSGK